MFFIHPYSVAHHYILFYAQNLKLNFMPHFLVKPFIIFHYSLELYILVLPYSLIITEVKSEQRNFKYKHLAQVTFSDELQIYHSYYEL